MFDLLHFRQQKKKKKANNYTNESFCIRFSVKSKKPAV